MIVLLIDITEVLFCEDLVILSIYKLILFIFFF